VLLRHGHRVGDLVSGDVVLGHFMISDHVMGDYMLLCKTCGD
jgi:hypothetical protein